MKKIAPTLRRLIDFPLQRGTWFPPGTTVDDACQAQAELRALLAVARAANVNRHPRVNRDDNLMERYTHLAGWFDKLDRALARLDKVSK